MTTGGERTVTPYDAERVDPDDPPEWASVVVTVSSAARGEVAVAPRMGETLRVAEDGPNLVRVLPVHRPPSASDVDADGVIPPGRVDSYTELGLVAVSDGSWRAFAWDSVVLADTEVSASSPGDALRALADAFDAATGEVRES